MRTGSNIFATTTGIVVTGLLFGVLAVLLQQAGNPGNMGICVVCFNRDIAGAIGLHRAAVVQYLRPEIMGMVLGGLVRPCFSANTSRAAVPPPSPAFCWALWQA